MTRTEGATAPWAARDRKERRENFFKGLNEVSYRSNVQSSAEQQRQHSSDDFTIASATDSEAVEDHQITDLDWKKFETSLPKGRFEEGLLWPVEAEISRLSSGFGIRKNGRFHEGLDLAAPYGSKIKAVTAGQVVFSGIIKGYGRTIVVYHGSQVASVYAHNSINLKRVGDKVNQGDAIAKVGRSGRARGAHVHFEMRRDGKPINPLRFTYKNSPLVAQR